MTALHETQCLACEGGVPPLSADEINQLLLEVNDWQLHDDGKSLKRHYTFKNFYKTMAFVNAVACIANQENHHPDMEIGYDYCLIRYTTHAVNGLTKNDFICAAKINKLETL